MDLHEFKHLRVTCTIYIPITSRQTSSADEDDSVRLEAPDRPSREIPPWSRMKKGLENNVLITSTNVLTHDTGCGFSSYLPFAIKPFLRFFGISSYNNLFRVGYDLSFASMTHVLFMYLINNLYFCCNCKHLKNIFMDVCGEIQ